MEIKKWKTGWILMSVLLAFTSLPVSAGEVIEQKESPVELTGEVEDNVIYPVEEQETIAEDSSEDSEADHEEITEESAQECTLAVSSVTEYDLSSDKIRIRLKERETPIIYSGKEVEPEFEVLYSEGGWKMQDGSEIAVSKEFIIDEKYYQAEYMNNLNAGTAEIVVSGKNEGDILCTGTKKLQFDIQPMDIAKCVLDIPQTMDYTGKPVIPDVKIHYGELTLSSNKDYKITCTNNIKMGVASIRIDGTGNFTGNVTGQFSICFGTPVVKITSNYSKIKLSWKKIKNAAGYQVYRSTSLNGKYKKVKEYKSGSANTYSDTKAKFNKTYYYKVRAYEKVKVKGKKKTKIKYGAWSEVVTAKKHLLKTSVTSAKCSSTTSAKVKWKKVTGAQGYEVYCCDTANGTYKCVGKLKGSGKTSLTVKKLKCGTRYYFKVRAYRKVGTKKCYGTFSSAKAETFSEGQRLYFLFPNGVPTSKAQMEQYLVTITVPIKDANGIPSTMELRVHGSLVKEFTGAFLDMYAIGFPVRAEDTDTYVWRSMVSGRNRSHHSYGCVIDLNWNSNPMIGVTEGKYRPGVDPYSVTPEVVAIWKKHGFYWGGNWSSSKDYMHFSYTNH